MSSLLMSVAACKRVIIWGCCGRSTTLARWGTNKAKRCGKPCGRGTKWLMFLGKTNDMRFYILYKIGFGKEIQDKHRPGSWPTPLNTR
jgi:hypothetical protein